VIVGRTVMVGRGGIDVGIDARIDRTADVSVAYWVVEMDSSAGVPARERKH